jgi:transcriptional regulator with XRE-family HTH domain
MGHAGRHIPNRLRKFRKISGYSQTDVMKLLGFKSTNRISRWEKGLAFPSVENLLKLSILYRTLADQLYPDLRNKFIQELSVKQKALFKNIKSNKHDRT